MRYQVESPTTLTYIASENNFVVREEKLTNDIQKCKYVAIHHSALCNFVNCEHFGMLQFAEYSQNIVHRKSNTMFSAVSIKRIELVGIGKMEFKLIDQKVNFTYNGKCTPSKSMAYPYTSQDFRFWIDHEHSAVMVADTQWCFPNIR